MSNNALPTSPRNPCRVIAPARLHLGFLDPAAALGRRFGSLGLALEELATIVSAAPHESLFVSSAVSGAADDRAQALAERVCAHYHLPQQARLNIEQCIPEHAGLGSGTQLALAIGSALTALYGRQATAAELAALLGRGRRSGIGLGLFDHGGLVVDGGHGTASATPPVIARLEFPAAWRIILVLDRTATGLSGGAEVQAFAALEPLSAERAAHLCHLTLMRLLPAVAECDFAPFAAAVGEIQAIVGDHFAGVQCGRFSSALVCRAIERLVHEHGLRGVGQSSWGPTGFAFAPDAAKADAALADLQAHFAAVPDLDFQVVCARNRGAELAPLTLAAPRRRAGA